MGGLLLFCSKFCLTWLVLYRYLRHFPTRYCKRWRPLQEQMMWQRSGQSNFRRLMDFCLDFLLVLAWWHPSSRPSLMPPMSCGHPKHLLANLLESSGALVFMGEVRSLLREFLTFDFSYGNISLSYINWHAYKSGKGISSEIVVSPLETILNSSKLKVRRWSLGQIFVSILL